MANIGVKLRTFSKSTQILQGFLV